MDFKILLIRSAFYAPMLLTAEKFLPASGATVHTRFRKDENPAALVKTGELDFAQLAPSAAMVQLSGGDNDPAIHIASINERDGFLLISRNPEPDFRWQDLEGRTIVPASFAVQPEACLRYALHLQGVDANKVTLVSGLNGMQAAADAFASGTGDYVQLQDPMARNMVHAGKGHLTASFGDAIGPIAFSSIVTSSTTLRERPALVRQFMQAYSETRHWMGDADAARIADAIRPWFEQTDMNVLIDAVQGYKSLGAWTRKTAIEHDAFDAAMRMMLHSPDITGITERYDFAQCCNDSFARAVDG